MPKALIVLDGLGHNRILYFIDVGWGLCTSPRQWAENTWTSSIPGLVQFAGSVNIFVFPVVPGIQHKACNAVQGDRPQEIFPHVGGVK